MATQEKKTIDEDMTIVERAIVVRECLKALGLSSRQVSVRVHKGNWSDSLAVCIRDESVSFRTVNEIAKVHELDTGNKGGNRYVLVSYSNAAISEVVANCDGLRTRSQVVAELVRS